MLKKITLTPFDCDEEARLSPSVCIGVQRAFGLDKRFTESMKIAVEILLAEEARLAIVAALHDVERDFVEVNSGAAWHVSIIRWKLNRAWPLRFLT